MTSSETSDNLALPIGRRRSCDSLEPTQTGEAGCDSTDIGGLRRLTLKRLVEKPNQLGILNGIANLDSLASKSRRRVEFCDTQSPDRKSTRLNSSHLGISYAVFCL